MGRSVSIDSVAKMKFIRQGRKTVTIEKSAGSTKYTIHDVNFDNINDWDVFNKDTEDDSVSSGPLNPNLAEKSI